MADIKRLNLTFTMSQPVQRRAWQALQNIPVGKRADWVCRIISEQSDRKRRRKFLNDIRNIVHEELQNLQIGAVIDTPEKIKEPEPQNVSDDVLGFLRSLQDGDGIG